MSERAITDVQPDVLLVGNDLTLEGRAAVRVAARAGVATVSIQHGEIFATCDHSTHIVDKMLVHGQQAADALMSQGLSSTQVKVTGAPGLADLANHGVGQGQVVRQALGLRADEPMVLLATSGPGHTVTLDHHRRIIAVVSQVSVWFPGIRFVAKLHQKDRPQYYARVLDVGGAAALRVVDFEDPGFPRGIGPWLDACDCLITGASTTGQEALLRQLPVITLDLDGALSFSPLIADGVSYHATSADSLAEHIGSVVVRGVRHDEERQRAGDFLGRRWSNRGLDSSAADLAAAEAIALIRNLGRCVPKARC